MWNDIANYTSGTIGRIVNQDNERISGFYNSGTIQEIVNQNNGVISYIQNNATGVLTNGIVNSNYGIISSVTSTGKIGLNTLTDIKNPAHQGKGTHIYNTNASEKAITIANIDISESNIGNGGRLKLNVGANKAIFVKQVTTSNLEKKEYYLEDFIEEVDGKWILGTDENGKETEQQLRVNSSNPLFHSFNVGRRNARGIVPTLNTPVLAGSIVSQSIANNMRTQGVRLGSILKEFSVKNFQPFTRKSQKKNAKARIPDAHFNASDSLNAYPLPLALDTYASLSLGIHQVIDSNPQTWSEEDLLRELDEIFIANQQGGKYYTFVAPYFPSESFKAGVGKLKWHSKGILAGVQTPLKNDLGILGVFFGYEEIDKHLNSPSFRGNLDFEDASYLLGFSYYAIFAKNQLAEYYFSGNTRVGISEHSIYRQWNENRIPHFTKADPKSYGYGLESRIGINLYDITDNSVFSPEIELSYQGINTENYRLRYDTQAEHYYAQDSNTLDVIAGLRLQKALTPVAKTNFSLGAYLNLCEEGQVKGNVAGFLLSDKIRTSSYYGYTNAGIAYAILKNAELSFNYDGILGDKAQLHAGYIRVGVWW